MMSECNGGIVRDCYKMTLRLQSEYHTFTQNIGQNVKKLENKVVK